MGVADRAAFRERARVVLDGPLPHPDYAKVWAYDLALIGGREETEIILGAWGRLDRNGRSKLLEVLGGPDHPEMLPHLRAWLDDPEIARDVLAQALPRHGAAGREILLGYALDPARPADLRRRAYDVLATTDPGVRLLLRASDDPARRARLAELPALGADFRAKLTEARDKVRYAHALNFYRHAATLTGPAQRGALPPRAWTRRRTPARPRPPQRRRR